MNYLDLQEINFLLLDNPSYAEFDYAVKGRSFYIEGEISDEGEVSALGGVRFRSYVREVTDSSKNVVAAYD